MDNNKNYIIFKDVIYLDGDLWRYIKEELLLKEKNLCGNGISLTSYPIYQKKPNGEMVPNGFLSKKPSAVYFFDVTEANDETKEQIKTKYDVEIHELPVPTRKVSQYMALLPVTSNIYAKGVLTQEEMNALGHEYMLVENRGESYKVTKCILSRLQIRLNHEVYLKIDFSRLSNELENKVLPEVCHLVINENGYYDEINVEEDVKRYNIKRN